jgi:hypothetical protein
MTESQRFEDMTSAEMDTALDKLIAGEPVTQIERAAASFRLNQFPVDPAYEADLLLGVEKESK